MNDSNHAWNDGKPIRTKKQPCGCYITAKHFTLCAWGKDLKHSADGWYKAYLNEREPRGTFDYKAAHFGNFETHKQAYLKHIRTGKDWVL
jgi:hypothetical protein